MGHWMRNSSGKTSRTWTPIHSISLIPSEQPQSVSHSNTQPSRGSRWILPHISRIYLLRQIIYPIWLSEVQEQSPRWLRLLLTGSGSCYCWKVRSEQSTWWSSDNRDRTGRVCVDQSWKWKRCWRTRGCRQRISTIRRVSPNLLVSAFSSSSVSCWSKVFLPQVSYSPMTGIPLIP